jgi:glycosyltransferase involved in cell wall biosynthesis
MTRLRKIYRSLKELGADVRIMDPYREPRGLPRILKGIIRYILLSIQVALSKADIYHFFNVPDITGLPLLWKRGVLVYDVRSPWFSSIKESLGSNALSRIAGIVERVMTIGADVVLAANYPLAHRARKWGANNIIVIPNYPTSDFGPLRDRDAMRNELNLGTNPAVLYVGKISKIEGSDLLKQIILEVSTELPAVRFLIVGDGPEKHSVDTFIERHSLTENVVSTGWIPHKEVADYIVASDLCLFPRKWDSFSPYTTPENITKVAEYLAVGRPIIAPKIGGFTTAEFPVIVVDPRDMGKAVLEYLKNPRPLGAFERPSWSTSHNRLRRIYTRLGAIQA